MPAQLQHLVGTAQEQHIEIRVVPFGTAHTRDCWVRSRFWSSTANSATFSTWRVGVPRVRS
ncbi:Scr1 family TA system antitoxin-like transcriptional regulator [Spirillospora sp. CA-255316]